MPNSAARPDGHAPRRARAPGLRAALTWACLALLSTATRAADPTATERLMGMADCIRDAGDMKGAPREAFMTDCMARKARATAAVAPPAAVAAEPVLPGQAVAPVAPAPIAPLDPDALPPQERILACATASKGMQGEARQAYLRQCLKQDNAAPALVAERAQRRAGCASQARLQPPEERVAFIDECMNGRGPGAVRGSVAPGVINQATVPKLRDTGAARQRAACVVAARDQQGAARQAFIERCVAAHPGLPQAAVAPAPATSASNPAQDRMLRNQVCTDQVRAQAMTGAKAMAFMNTCMARP
ncbi:MAG: hypothetical protein IPM80_04210 [Proteobacteria bacterium]|nr:hypothetical protein [Pseudomonadota bacterium]